MPDISNARPNPDQMRTWSIGQIAKEFGVTPRALRFYEDKGLLDPSRDGLNRLYGTRDRARLKLILRGKRIGLSLEDIRDLLDMYDLNDNQRTQLVHSLEKFRQQRDVLVSQRQDLESAIETLDRGVEFLEEEVAKIAQEAQAQAVPTSPPKGATADALRAIGMKK